MIRDILEYDSTNQTKSPVTSADMIRTLGDILCKSGTLTTVERGQFISLLVQNGTITAALDAVLSQVLGQ
jgi:hypothetical protein